MATLSPKELLAQLEALRSNVLPELSSDQDLRFRLCRAAREAFLALEQPTDVVARILLSQPVEGITVRIATDLNLFTILAEKGDQMTLDELAEATKAEPVLLSRILRSLACFGAILEVGSDGYVLSPSYGLYANPSFAKGLASCAEFLNPAYQALPGYLASRNYKGSPTDPDDTAVQEAFDSKGKDLIKILMERPDSARGFGTLMSTWGEGHSLIQDLYPINERLPKGFENTRESVMFVDVGGGYGQKAIALKRACPELPGRFIVQDLPGTVANAPKTKDIEMIGHDFFTEQPIKGARAYYIRQCLHNWPVEKCLTILKHLRDAMKPGYSKLFVHELIVADRGASIWATTQDFNMMTLCATLERTESQWREMLEQAGLKVVGVYPSKDGESEGIIEAEKA